MKKRSPSGNVSERACAKCVKKGSPPNQCRVMRSKSNTRRRTGIARGARVTSLSTATDVIRNSPPPEHLERRPEGGNPPCTQDAYREDDGSIAEARTLACHGTKGAVQGRQWQSAQVGLHPVGELRGGEENARADEHRHHDEVHQTSCRLRVLRARS